MVDTKIMVNSKVTSLILCARCGFDEQKQFNLIGLFDELAAGNLSFIILTTMRGGSGTQRIVHVIELADVATNEMKRIAEFRRDVLVGGPMSTTRCITPLQLNFEAGSYTLSVYINDDLSQLITFRITPQPS